MKQKNKLLKNKKGIAWIPILIVGSLILFLVFGIGSVIKFNSLISSVPTWAWIAIAVVLFLIIIPKK